jgi:hypothetical protein
LGVKANIRPRRPGIEEPESPPRVASMKKDTGEKIDGGYVASTKRTPG